MSSSRTFEPDDNSAYRFPVSVKGVITRRGSVVLLQNEREEWELPGGKLELGEDPSECLSREVEEELGLAVRPDTLIDLWPYHISDRIDVLVVVYACTDLDPTRAPTISHEHKELRWFDYGSIGELTMPAGYKRSISKAVHGTY